MDRTGTCGMSACVCGAGAAPCRGLRRVKILHAFAGTSRWESLAGLRKGLQLFSRRDSEGTYQTVLGLFVVEASLTIELPKW